MLRDDDASRISPSHHLSHLLEGGEIFRVRHDRPDRGLLKGITVKPYHLSAPLKPSLFEPHMTNMLTITGIE